MGQVVHLKDAHELVQLLLPWHVNRTLEPADAALVEAHLEECEECREDVAANQAMRAHYAAMPAPLPAASAHKPAALLRGSPIRFLRRRVSLGWALAANAAVAAALILLITVPSTKPKEDFHLLGSGTVEGTANAIVLFSPEIAADDLRAALNGAGAQVVGGPTASGAFMLRVDLDKRAAALDRLRRTEHVLLAEPIDQADGP